MSLNDNGSQSCHDRPGAKLDEYSCVEISNIPKKMTGRSLTAMIVSASDKLPKSTHICLKTSPDGEEFVGLVDFKTENDAVMAIARVRSTPYGRKWIMKIMKNPRNNDERSETVYSEPELTQM